MHPVSKELDWPKATDDDLLLEDQPRTTLPSARHVTPDQPLEELQLDPSSEERAIGVTAKGRAGSDVPYFRVESESAAPNQSNEVKKTTLELLCGDILCEFEVGLFKFSRKLITVFGATEQQGEDVVGALWGKNQFRLRGITGDLGGEMSKRWQEKGVEMVTVDFNDPSSVEAAVKGSYGVFFTTSYLYKDDQGRMAASEEREIQQGMMIADACKKAKVKHVVYSNLEPIEKAVGIPPPHYDTKAAVQKYIDEIGLPNTGVCLPAYYEMFIMGSLYFKKEDNTYEYVTCMQGPVDSMNIEDCGLAVASIFAQSEWLIGKKVRLVGDQLTVKEYVDIVAKTIEKRIYVKTVSLDEFANKLPFPGAAAIFKFYKEGNSERDIAVTKELSVTTERFKAWASNQKELECINLPD